MGSWKMRWSVTRFTDSVHVRILTLNGYNCCGSPRAVLGMHPGRIRQDLPVGENLAMAQIFLNQFVKVQGNYPVRDFRAPARYVLLRSDGGGILCCMS